MPRRKTHFSPAGFYHIYNRGNNRENIFLEPENYRFFLQRLHFYYDPQDIHLIAYCLMPNHYHLVTGIGKVVDFSNVMRSFSVSYVKSFNKAYSHVGHLFQGNFEARDVCADNDLAYLIRYVHLNPVRAGLVKKAENWKYSDHNEWISDSALVDSTQTEIRARLFGGPAEYEKFCGDLSGELPLREELEALLFSRVKTPISH